MTTQAPFEEVTMFEPDDTTTTDLNAEGKEELMDPMALTDLLADVSIDSLEQMVEEYLPEQEETETESNKEYEEYEEYDDPVDYSGESQNACPVKMEVVAPYWANNTRNQILALLNLYPFEQYIHTEKCQYEHEEMLCRKGCRCEQQYRLHRLLAFDPNNECRGIFSDWFRFPSYCLCKCYNIPADFLPKQIRKPKLEYEPKSEDIPLTTSQEESLGSGEERSLQNIPAILPYEAKQALLRELSRNERKMEDDHFFYSAPVMEFNLANGQTGSVGQTPRKK